MEYGFCDYPVIHILPYKVGISVGEINTWNH